MALSKLGRASPCLHRRHPCSARAPRLLANLSFGPIVQQAYTPLAREGSECDSRSVHESAVSSEMGSSSNRQDASPASWSWGFEFPRLHDFARLAQW